MPRSLTEQHAVHGPLVRPLRGVGLPTRSVSVLSIDTSQTWHCLVYTSDAPDEESSVTLVSLRTPTQQTP